MYNKKKLPNPFRQPSPQTMGFGTGLLWQQVGLQNNIAVIFITIQYQSKCVYIYIL